MDLVGVFDDAAPEIAESYLMNMTQLGVARKRAPVATTLSKVETITIDIVKPLPFPSAHREAGSTSDQTAPLFTSSTIRAHSKTKKVTWSICWTLGSCELEIFC